METRKHVLARAVVSAWKNNEPFGLLLNALYRECGMSKGVAHAEVNWIKANEEGSPVNAH